jgi:hypothetical protein
MTIANGVPALAALAAALLGDESARKDAAAITARLGVTGLEPAPAGFLTVDPAPGCSLLEVDVDDGVVRAVVLQLSEPVPLRGLADRLGPWEDASLFSHAVHIRQVRFFPPGAQVVATLDDTGRAATAVLVSPA